MSRSHERKEISDYSLGGRYDIDRKGNLMAEAEISILDGKIRVWRPLDFCDGEGVFNNKRHSIEVGQPIVSNKDLIADRLANQAGIARTKLQHMSQRRKISNFLD